MRRRAARFQLAASTGNGAEPIVIVSMLYPSERLPAAIVEPMALGMVLVMFLYPLKPYRLRWPIWLVNAGPIPEPALLPQPFCDLVNSGTADVEPCGERRFGSLLTYYL